MKINSIIANPDYDGCVFKPEIRIPGSKLLWGKYFPVDICVYKNNEIVEIILNKAPASNIRQNHVNSIASLNSDIDRLSKSGNGLDNIKISLFNFLPKKSPFFKRNETIKNFEKNETFFLMKSGIVKKFCIDQVYIIFEIDGLENCESKLDVENLFSNSNPIKNISIEEFNYIPVKN